MIWGIVLVVVVVGIAWAMGGFSNQPTTSTSTGTTGQVVFAVTDAAADIQNVSEIKMSVSKVEMHSEAQGWVTVSNEAQEFNLLKLKADGRWEAAAQASVAADTYNQVRLIVSSVTVMTKDGASHDAKLPSGELKINTIVAVAADATSTVAVDIKGDASLHLTGNGKYIFAPVVHVETRSDADATVGSDDSVVITGGTVQSAVNAGMDVSGEVKNDFRLETDIKLNLDTNGVIQINSNASSGVKVGL